MTGVTEDDIPRLQIKVQWLLALVQERHNLRLRQVQYMAAGVATKTLRAAVVGLR
jgi:hypothetical protein